MKIVALSDTHTFPVYGDPNLPQGDVLIHAGDLCIHGGEGEWKSQIRHLGLCKYKQILYVPGNHDRWCYDNRQAAENFCDKNGITMLVDATTEIENIRIHGSPWTPNFGSTRAFMHDFNSAQEHWAKLLQDDYADILVTHGPPAGILDRCPLPVGCPWLLDAVETVRPQLHIFGHVHGNQGYRHRKWDVGSSTTFVNVACMDSTHRPYSPSKGPIFTCTVSKLPNEASMIMHEWGGYLTGMVE